ncbi:polysaccharide deacetylase [Bacillus sp. FJAT-27231]|uniref:polysaccharide deacetylase family protein n=1 Tax=Bacillus sp. FJAT-27231 TaxID=1679168 RepID=UPI000670D7A9|nr:polysaccharide deacetylase family protein [Bacillus sp. FJAT-27231]KMY53488.1 polysaccharide deacetylase [Bacillus sp. FJAT-27231]
MRKLTILCTLLLLIGCSNQGVQEQKEETAPPEEKKALNQQTDKGEGDRLADKERKAPLYRVNQKNWSMEPIGKANPAAVLLTIDDAPERYALEMAKILKKEKASAIFFVNGKFLEEDNNKRMLEEIAQMGFEIGNHTYSHKDLKSLPEAEQKEEILKVNKIVEKITGKRPVFFRAPFGHYTDFSKQVILEEKMIPMNWTYGYDWEKEYQKKESLSDVMVNTPFLINGANLLMHDRQWTKEALSDIVSGIRGKGYEIIDPKTIQTK